ncbi:hypothetical protein CVT24_009517 [Panaeolus cyanescens]|uniref:F-box domain-containing protein n=1 Tax=Panaeolus cyanescens TaxID=181874 RepID=A0A409VYF1_9AGAR|nr:hypothetical protein CVT24_009517 [Panaeolus cyanescens]
MGARIPMPTDESYPHCPLFSKSPLQPLYPIALSQVCIQWRELVLQMPVLWRYIHVSRSAEAHRRLKSQIQRSLEWLPTYLIRSGDQPLHITIDTTRVPFPATLPLLAKASGRWASLTLLVSHVGHLPPILSVLGNTHVPALNSLTIASDIYREGIVVYDALPAFFDYAPSLTRIKLLGTYTAWNAPPFSNLLQMELCYASHWPDFESLGSLFAASPNLRQLVIHDDIAQILHNVDLPRNYEQIRLMSLTYLEIRVYRLRRAKAEVARLVALFFLPSLRTLHLKEIFKDEWKELYRAFGFPLHPGDFDHTYPHRALEYFPALSNLNVEFAI